MHAQQGLFLFSNDPTADLVELPTPEPAHAGPDRLKVTISRELKSAVRQVLMRMNLTAAALFPGIDGLGRLLQEIAETRRSPKRTPPTTKAVATGVRILSVPRSAWDRTLRRSASRSASPLLGARRRG